MGFKMNGSPAKLGTISGTAGHRSALKMKEEADAASALKYRKNTPPPTSPPTPTPDPNIGKKGLYKSDKSWKEGMEASDGKLNDLVAQRKALKAKGGDYKKSTEYAAIQNQINKALGNKKRRGVTETTEDKTTTKTTPGVATTVTEERRGAGSVFGGKVTKETEFEGGKKVSSKYKTSKKGGATVSDVEGVRKVKTKTTDKDKGVDEKRKTKYDKSGEITKQKTTVKDDDVVTKTITKGTGDDVTKRVKTRKKGGTGLGSWLKRVTKKKDKSPVEKKWTPGTAGTKTKTKTTSGGTKTKTKTY